MTKLIKDFRRKLADKSVLALQKVHWISTNSDNRMCATNGAGTAHTHKTKDWVTRTPLKPRMNSGASEHIVYISVA
jgi:hypothetical protein